jgi:hypothetical protein
MSQHWTIFSSKEPLENTQTDTSQLASNALTISPYYRHLSSFLRYRDIKTSLASSPHSRALLKYVYQDHGKHKIDINTCKGDFSELVKHNFGTFAFKPTANEKQEKVCRGNKLPK